MKNATFRVILDPECCKGCLLCLNVCPNDLIVCGTHSNKQGFFPVKMQDESYCINCMRCVDVCPDRAFVVPDKKRFNWEGYIYWASRQLSLYKQKK